MNKFSCAVNKTTHGFNIESCTILVKDYMPLYIALAEIMGFVILFYMILKIIDWVKGFDLEW